jgi:hypothetical protein
MIAEGALAALALFLLLALPSVMIMAFAGMTVVALLMSLGSLLFQRHRLRRWLRSLAFDAGLLLLAWALIGVNFHVAQARIRTVVDAVHAYQAANGALPDDLDALVPAYLDHVPRATYWLTMNEFRWHENGLLTCVPSPPIGWIGYDFQADAPTALD